MVQKGKECNIVKGTCCLQILVKYHIQCINTSPVDPGSNRPWAWLLPSGNYNNFFSWETRNSQILNTQKNHWTSNIHQFVANEHTLGGKWINPFSASANLIILVFVTNNCWNLQKVSWFVSFSQIPWTLLIFILREKKLELLCERN